MLSRFSISESSSIVEGRLEELKFEEAKPNWSWENSKRLRVNFPNSKLNDSPWSPNVSVSCFDKHGREINTSSRIKDDYLFDFQELTRPKISVRNGTREISRNIPLPILITNILDTSSADETDIHQGNPIVGEYSRFFTDYSDYVLVLHVMIRDAILDSIQLPIGKKIHVDLITRERVFSITEVPIRGNKHW